MSEEGEELAEHIFEAGQDNPFAQPQAWHRVEALTDDLEWYLEFYCRPEDYFPKKYGSNPVHSEVLEAMQTVRLGRALDLGCGQGRNALFLAKQGFEVTAVDQNELALEILRSIVEQEDLEMPVGSYDINSASLTQTYDLIVSTVVLMFLQADLGRQRVHAVQSAATDGPLRIGPAAGRCSAGLSGASARSGSGPHCTTNDLHVQKNHTNRPQISPRLSHGATQER